MNYQIEDYIINFVARKETPEDVEKLKEWLAVDPERKNELKRLLAIYDSAGIKDISGTISPENAYQRFMFHINSEKNKTSTEDTSEKSSTSNKKKNSTIIRINNYRIISRIAAIFIISFSLGIMSHYYFSNNQSNQIVFTENIVPLGSKSVIKLPDGSSVLLNSGSTMRYPSDYGKNKREIYLEGEAYFNVVQQNKIPFTVFTALSNIRVLGTEFNVKAYPEEKVVETTLIRGKVTVEKGETIDHFESAILNTPGQKLSVSLSDNKPTLILTQLEPDIATAEVSWKEQKWRIESISLSDLAIKLERRYNVKIYVDETLKSHHFTGTFENESLEQVLSAIQFSAPILYRLEGKEVYVTVDTAKSSE